MDDLNPSETRGVVCKKKNKENAAGQTHSLHQRGERPPSLGTRCKVKEMRCSARKSYNWRTGGVASIT